jgi:hypothetical protein
MIVRFEMVDNVLPVGRQYVAGCALQPLIDLFYRQYNENTKSGYLHSPMFPYKARQRGHTPALKAAYSKSVFITRYITVALIRVHYTAALAPTATN